MASAVNIPTLCAQESASALGEEKQAHADDKVKLQDMERIKSEIETRMSRLKDLTDELVTENAQLKVDNALLQDEAQRYRAENDELRSEAEVLSQRNSDLKDKVRTDLLAQTMHHQHCPSSRPELSCTPSDDVRHATRMLCRCNC